MTGYTQLVDLFDTASMQIKWWKGRKSNHRHARILFATIALSKVIRREVQGNTGELCSLYQAINRAFLKTDSLLGINIALQANLRIMEDQYPKLAKKEFQV